MLGRSRRNVKYAAFHIEERCLKKFFFHLAVFSTSRRPLAQYLSRWIFIFFLREKRLRWTTRNKMALEKFNERLNQLLSVVEMISRHALVDI